MNASTNSLRGRLRAIEPGQATHQSAWIQSLNHRIFGDLSLSAEAAALEPVEGPWIAFENGGGRRLFLRPLLAAEEVPTLNDAAGRPDAAMAAAAMGRIEPLIGAIERVVGTVLNPVEMVEQTESGLPLTVTASRGEVLLHRALLIVPPDLSVSDAPLPLDPAFAARTIPTLTARIAGPAVSHATLSHIGPGDLLLLGVGPPMARFSPPSQDTTMVALVDPQGGVMVVKQALDTSTVPPTNEPVGNRPVETGELPIPTMIEIDATGLTADRLAALAPGSVVPIAGASGDVLPVRIRAAGRIIAAGELVAVGEGYGVLVTARPTAGGGED